MKKNNKKAFSIIEVLVWILIFLVWITWIFSIINSTLNLNDFNKNYIIWVNLAREQLELFRNLRDTNFSASKSYNVINCDAAWDCTKFEKWKTYKISTDFENSDFEIKVVSNDKKIEKPYKLAELEKYRVCLFEKWNTPDEKFIYYDYCEGKTNELKKLNIFKFMEVSSIDENILDFKKYDLNDEKALKMTSKVIWYSKKYNEFEVSSVFTNYKY